MNGTRSGFWRHFWALFKPYWFSEERLIARLLLFAIIALTLGMVYMNVQINEWQNLFFNTLQGQRQSRVLSTDPALRACAAVVRSAERRSITARKRGRLIATARHYLSQQIATPACRFDAVLIEHDGAPEWIKDVLGE
jgi:ABC-type uncharacterized transport system fused permease/ATPase subunit